MPLHLTKFDSYPNEGAAPDPTTLEAGFPVVISGILSVVNDTQDGYEAIGGVGGTEFRYGSPRQIFAPLGNLWSNANKFSNTVDWGYKYNGSATEQKYTTDGSPRLFTEYVSGINKGTLSIFGLAPGVTDFTKPNSARMTVTWYQPSVGTLEIDPYIQSFVGSATIDYNITLDGSPTTVSIAAGSTIDYGTNTQTFPVSVGEHTLTIEFEHASGADDTNLVRCSMVVEPDGAPPDDGTIYWDDLRGGLWRFHTNAAPTIAFWNKNFDGGGDWQQAEQHYIDPTAVYIEIDGAATSHGDNAVGPGSHFYEYTAYDTLFGMSAADLIAPTIMGGPYGYDVTAVGWDASAQWYGSAFGEGAFASEEASALGAFAEASPQGLAAGTYTKANPWLNTVQATEPTYVVNNAAGGTDTSFEAYYRVRGLDANGMPTTRWSLDQFAGKPQKGPGDTVSVNWVSGDYPAGTVNVEVIRHNSDSSTVHLGTVAVGTQTLTDDGTEQEQWRYPSNSALAFDHYNYDPKGAVAVGFNVQATYPNSSIFGWSASGEATDVADQQKIGADESTFITHPGGYEGRLVATTTTPYTVDGSGYDRIIAMDATAATKQIDLPATPRVGRIITVKKADSSANAVTVETPGAETIDGAANLSLGSAWEKATLVFDGTNWLTI